jgi:hypothetical protein
VEIYQRALSLKYRNFIVDAVKLMKLIHPFLTQHLKWYTLHLKLIAIKKDWDQVEEEKFSYLLIP